jgi:hypothetical protein
MRIGKRHFVGKNQDQERWRDKQTRRSPSNAILGI